MKKTSILFAVLAAAFTVSCNKEISQSSEPQQVEKVPVSFTAGAESTKHIIDGQKIKYENTDSLGVFDGVQKNGFPIVASSISADGTSARFKGEAATASQYTLVMPAKAITAVALSDKHISIKIVSKQYVDANHKIDPAAMISTAVAAPNGTVNLTNQFSLVKVSITRNDVVSVTIQGNNNEIIGGTQWLSTEDGSIIDHASGTTETLYFKDAQGDPAAFVPGDYYIAVWPVTFTKGFTLKMNTSEGKVAFKTTGNEYTFAKNGGKNFGQIDANPDAFLGKTITTATELKTWARYARFWTNEDEFELGADIDLEGYNWPTVASFAGSLDGKNHSIKNFTVNNAATRTGFIGTLEANAELKDITFGASSGDSSSITLCQSDDANWCYAGIVGYLQTGSSLSGLTSYVPVTVSAACTGKHSAGGFAGNMKANTSITDCVNNAAVTDSSAYSSTSAEACIGGIVGMSDSAGSIIKDCTKNGQGTNPITNNCTGTQHIGGIVGRISGGGTVEGCTNNAYVYYKVASAYDNTSFKVGTAGIAGAVTGTNATIIKCTNENRAHITVAQTTRVGIGGVVGIATGAGLQILGCTNNSGMLSAEFTNTKDIAIGGIIGYSNNTITISKADETYTTNLKGFKQSKAYNGTAYVGGIAGLLDNDSDKNIVEYCTTTSGTRFEFNVSGANKKIINAGGICGASKGVIRNCTNNMHIYARKASDSTIPYVKYGGICGGASNTRHPRLVTNCTNNGNFGGYNLEGNTVMGGIVAVMYPDLMNVTFCTNNGTATTGQCQTGGGIQSVQNNSSYELGGLCGDLEKPAQGTDPITIFEGCVINCKFIKQKNSNYQWTGLVAGWPSGSKSETGYPKLILGTPENPIQIINTTKIETGTDANPTVETVWYNIDSVDNAKLFFFGPQLYPKRPDGGSGRGNFTSIDGDDFKARFELNFTVGAPSNSTTEQIN